MITTDVPLLKVGASVMAPNGRPFTEDAIGMAVGMCDLMTDLRATGEVTEGPRAFGPRDRSAFLSAFDQVIRRLQRASWLA